MHRLYGPSCLVYLTIPPPFRVLEYHVGCCPSYLGVAMHTASRPCFSTSTVISLVDSHRPVVSLPSRFFRPPWKSKHRCPLHYTVTLIDGSGSLTRSSRKAYLKDAFIRPTKMTEITITHFTFRPHANGCPQFKRHYSVNNTI